ncbi:hypothetical protein MF4836_18840, partial [Pseudomonas sp. MF4836]
TETLRSVSIGAATLHSGSTRLLHTLAIGVDDAQALARGAMQRMRNTAISAAPAGADLLLGLGSLWFQQDSLRKNFETFLNTPGSGNPEALAAVWSSSIGVMGVGVEIAGVGTQLLRPGLTTTVRVAGQVQTVMMGVRIAQYGGAIAAVAGVMDGVQYGFAAKRTAKQGDDPSATGYAVAAAVAFFSGGIGIGAALATQAVLLGPLGFALVLGLTAYSIALWAKKTESSPLELWVRHSRWGKPEKYRRWTSIDDFDIAVGALNAAVLGMTAEVAVGVRLQRTSDLIAAGETEIIIRDGFSIPAGIYLDYKITLPGYDPKTSRYSWKLKVFRPGDEGGMIIASGRSGSSSNLILPPASLKCPDYNPRTTTPELKEDVVSRVLSISGAIALNQTHSVHAIELEVSYWPNLADELGVAFLIAKEDKIDVDKKGD